MASKKEIPEELKKKLQKTADDNNALVMSFIAPDTIVRKSPVSYDYAKITYQDLYNIEEKIEKIKEEDKLPKKLYLIIHSPGGRADATTKIARYLRDSFDEIEAYVPYEAASGGTVLCLVANFIVMGATSNLTPIDPQIPYKGSTISATSYEQAIQEMMKKYSTSSPNEIPSPDQQMCEKFDPIIAKEMSKTVFDSLIIALELLETSQKPKTPKDRDRIFNIAFSLTKTAYPHSHQIDAKSASEIGLTIIQDVDKIELLRTYKEWVSCKLNEKETNHIIEAFIPKEGGYNHETTNISASQESTEETRQRRGESKNGKDKKSV